MQHEVLDKFAAETWKSLTQVDVEIEHLADGPVDAATIADIRERLAEIKASCGFLGLRTLAVAARTVEELVCGVRHVMTTEQRIAILASLAEMRIILGTLEATREEPLVEIVAREERISLADCGIELCDEFFPDHVTFEEAVADEPVACECEEVVEAPEIVGTIPEAVAPVEEMPAIHLPPRRSVLVISPSVYLRHIVAAAMDKEGFESVSADGPEVLAKLVEKGAQFDLVISDAEQTSDSSPLVAKLLRDNARSPLTIARQGTRATANSVPRFDCRRLVTVVRESFVTP